MILALIHYCGQASAVEIGTERCTPGAVRERPVMLETLRFVSGHYDQSTSPRRIYALTGEGPQTVDRGVET